MLEAKQLGADHPETALSRVGLGELLVRQRDHAHALAYFQQALAIWERAHGPEHNNLIAPLAAISGCQLALGHAPEALAAAERAVAIAEKNPSDKAELEIAREALAAARKARRR